jgi:dCTP deaminase
VILFDSDILAAIQQGHVVIEPFDRKQLGTNSYDVRLAPTLLRYKAPFRGGHLDMRSENETEKIKMDDDGLLLEPGVLYLGSTMESVGTRGAYVPHLEGRSSVGRLGMGVHVTAGFGDAGFVGHWTMEITVVHPLRVYPGVRVAQAYFLEGKGTPERLYQGKYHSFDQPIASRMHQDGS